MELAAIALVAALVGLVVVTAIIAFRWSERRGLDPEPLREDEELPDEVSAVLTALRSAAIVLDVSDAVVKATTAAHALGLIRDSEVVHRDLLTMAASVRRDGLIVERELELPRGPVGRGIRVVYARVAPLGSLHVLLVVEDRTEARRVEQVRRDFVANVSHELKTPVGAISLLAETLEQAADDPEAVLRFAGRMRRESQRLAMLVQEIVDLSRIEGSPTLSAPALVTVDEVLTEAAERAHLAASAKEITIEKGPPCRQQVWGDQNLLVTAVRNLIDNAVLYSEPGTRIGVAARRSDAMVEIIVTDQGIGIGQDDQERVFERFYRVDQARSRATGGTGLGLSIVKHVVANHGGEVTVWSKVNAGSTFTIRLPRAEPSAASPPTTRSAPGASGPDTYPMAGARG